MQTKVKLYLFSLFMVISTFLLVQNKVSAQLNKPNVNIEKELQKIDSLRNISRELQSQILSQKLEQANSVISTQTTIMSSYGYIYVTVTIIIALITIALPIATYLFGIKPSQKALEDFDKYAESKFGSFLQKNRTTSIDNAINNIKSNDAAIRNAAINFLSLNHEANLTEEQINEILEIIKAKSTDRTVIPSLEGAIAQQKNEKVKKYFTEVLNGNDKLFSFQFALRFFSLYNFEEYQNLIGIYIGNNPNTLSTIMALLSQFSSEALKNLINHEALLKSINDNEFLFLKVGIEHFLPGYNLSKTEFDNSYLKKRLAAIDQG